ncbi:hypothetical protein DFH11DRAFT_1587240, partial [Phellopilus nigrolimitatus]
RTRSSLNMRPRLKRSGKLEVLRHRWTSSRPDTSRSLLPMTLTGTTRAPVRSRQLSYIRIQLNFFFRCVHIRIGVSYSCRRSSHLPAQKRRHWRTLETARWTQPPREPAKPPRGRERERAAQGLPVAREDRRARAERHRRPAHLAGQPARSRPHRDRRRRAAREAEEDE